MANYHRAMNPDEPVDLGILLALAYQEFVRELRADMAHEGFDDLGRSDGFVFRMLGRGPLTITELAARLDISQQGAGQIVDDMTKRGYLQRRLDPSDARARLVELAPRGLAALATAHRFHQRYERQLVRAHGKAGLAVTREVLTKMAGVTPATLDPQLRALYL
jgi:DNA-binding MarR family transcriptional regulator